MANIRLLHRAIIRGGGPANLVSAVAEPTIESAQELMGHAGVSILAVTGGSGVVRQAMTSGKRAICAGPGNPPVVVDATADLELAGRNIVAGASFDNNIVCVDEKEVIAVASIVDELLRQMARHGAYILNDGEFRRVEQVIFSEQRGPRQRAVVAKELIGQNASEILARAGISCHGDPPLLVARVPNDHPLIWTEQMMPVLPVTAVADVDLGIELAKAAEHGFGHSAGMFSRDIDALSRMARTINTSIFTKNGPFYAGLGEGGEGHCSFTIASPTGEGLTGPVAFSRLRRCVLVDHFRIV
jgi:acyl-CoA reductase-like NAD-dependent aldehyde dehydrogenase